MSARPQARDLLRTWLTPKWLGATVLLLAFVAFCGFAGNWQFTRTQDIIAAEEAANAAAVPVEQIAEPDLPLPAASIGRPVTATGTYVAKGQVVVLHRALAGEAGVWVVTPLELSDGSVVAVLRGWLPDPEAPGIEPPSGDVSVTGIQHPDERFYADARPAAGTAVAIAAERLAEGWEQPTRPGFIVLAGQQPQTTPAPEPVPSMVDSSQAGFPLRNFGYALQWLAFAGFGFVAFGRWLWLDAAGAE